MRRSGRSFDPDPTAQVQIGNELSKMISHIVSIKNLILKRFILLYQISLSRSSLVQNVFSLSSSLLYSFVGYNLNCATLRVTEYSEADIYIAD